MKHIIYRDSNNNNNRNTNYKIKRLTTSNNKHTFKTTTIPIIQTYKWEYQQAITIKYIEIASTNIV